MITGIPREETERLLHRLASRFAGDAVSTDSMHVLRLRGFVNRKPSGELVVQERQKSTTVRSLGDFELLEDSPEAPTI
jgi:hypothetical protein